MAKKMQSEVIDTAPTTLSGHPFYGIRMDEAQERFRDAIWSEDKPVVFVNARAGTGKTTIAVATANLLVKYGRYKHIVYVMSPYGEGKQGFLPGGIDEKSEVYMTPLKQALIKCNENYMTVMEDSSFMNQKMGTAYVSPVTHTYLRGVTVEDSVVIIDEAQNYKFDDLKKTLTRVSDSCKLVVLGHDKQCDLHQRDNDNAFVKYLEHFKSDERCAVCELTKNYRGWISSFADELELNGR